MPVPRGWLEDGYYRPLRDLHVPNGVEIYLGLVHYTDAPAGNFARLDIAKRHLAGFGIATECGFGRRDPASVPKLLDILKLVASQT